MAADPVDGTGVEALQNRFLRARADTLDEGLFRLRAGEALAAAPGAARHLVAVRDHLLGRAVTPRQRQLLAPQLDTHLALAHDDLARHVAREKGAWERGVRAERLALLRDQARRDWGDAGKLALYGDAAASAGEDPDAARSGIWRAAIDAALTAGAHEAALDLHDRAREHLVPADAEALDAEREIARQMLAARDYVATLLPQPLPGTPADLDQVHRLATAQNEADWPHDAGQQATNQHLIDVSVGTHHRDLQQERARVGQEVEDWLARRDATGNPQTGRPPPALWKRLDAALREQVDARLARNARGDSSRKP
jgi:hypothetical protein